MENKKSPTRTFFILHRETILEAPPRFELGIKVLQTFALPLGYSADWSGLRGSNSLPPPWQGGALPDELRPHMVPPIGIEPMTRGFSVPCSTD